MKKKAIFCPHQGWADIINSLSLVNFYSNFYDEVKCLFREDSKEIVEYFTKELKNVNVVYTNKDNLNNLHHFIEDDADLLFHGIHDIFRKDNFRGAFNASSSTEHFVKRFYTLYGIPHEIIFKNFLFKRDLELEENIYNDFLSKHGPEYVLYHEPNYNPISLRTESNFVKINIDNKTKNIFSFIKILENSKEIHLVDSTWAALCYLLDCKYNTFKNINIFLYPYERSGALLRDKFQLSLNPVNLKNWKIVK
jgi:hypothetical protein